MATFLQNSWYCAGWSTDLGTQPIGRKMLGQPVVLYRDEAGTAHALADRCPHRFAPLHRGKVKGNTIECPYHGLRFDPAGHCVLNPHGEGNIPRAAVVKGYPLIERQGLFWIWFGDPVLADPAEIIDVEFLSDSRFATSTGSLDVKANYLLVIDNLLDLTHAPFLHAETVGGTPENSIGKRMRFQFRQEGNIVHSNYFVPGMPPTPQLKPLWSRPVGDFRALMQFHVASSLKLEVGMRDPDRPEDEGLVLPSVHLLVPRDEFTTGYYFAIGRNFAIDDAEQSHLMAEFTRRAFEQEDEPMVRACQENMGGTDLMALNPAFLPTDAAAVRARRMISARIAEEKATVK